MKTLLKKIAATAALSCSMLAAQASTLPGPLVDTKWLSANLDKVQVVEIRRNVKSFTTKPEISTDTKTGKKTIEEVGGHIPGSRLLESKFVRVDRKIGDLNLKFMIPERAEFEKIVQNAGIDSGKPIVVVPIGLDVSDLNDAMRMYWQFKVYGETDIAFLDGGMAAWLLDGMTHNTDAPAAMVGNWKSTSDQSARYYADSQDVANIQEKKNATLVDGRELPQFYGLVKRDTVQAFGHIEGAKSLSPDTTFRIAGGALKMLSSNTYKAVLSAQGINPSAPAVVYCNTGSQSGLPWFIMSEILGNKSVKQYDGSLHQWTMEKRPLVGAVPLQ